MLDALADPRAASLTALVEIDEGDLSFVEAGAGAAQALDVPEDRLAGRTLRALGFPSPARAQWSEALREAQHDGGIARVALALDTSRERRQIMLTATPLADSPGRFACVVEDATQPWRAFESLAGGGPALDALATIGGTGVLAYGTDLVIAAHGGTFPPGLIPLQDGQAASLDGTSAYDVLPKACADVLALALLDAPSASAAPVPLPGGTHEVRARAVRDGRGWPVGGIALVAPTASAPTHPVAPPSTERDTLVHVAHARLRREAEALLGALAIVPPVAAAHIAPLRARGHALLDTLDAVSYATEVLTAPAAPAPFRLDAVLQSLRPSLEGLTNDHGLDLFLFVPDQHVWALGHRLHFASALLGAVRYALTTTHKGAIRLAIRESEEGVQVQVADTGDGLPEAVRLGVFETHSLEGLGPDALDLYAARLLTEAMGGHISVRSEAQRGTLLTFALPASDPPVGSTMTERPAALLVEPDLDTRALLDLFLRDAWHTLPAETLGEAFEVAERQAIASSVGAVVLDLSHGLIDPEAAIRRLRASRTTDSAFVVALVASSLPEERDRHLRLGYDGVLVKPFSRQALMEVLAPVRR